mmetsp:Transcript_43797/g.103095  ORF Transcript_43797/g.103095 Transcript_43797/m.103095 type:complete len:441 (-) Transcript_43797:43-1365(-)
MQRGRYVVLEAVLKGAARGTPQHGRVVGASAARIARNNSAVFGSAAQRRSMSDESKKQAPPKAGPGFFATFMKSFREQMGEKEKSDEDLAKAREKLEESRLEALARANATMERAAKAAEAARERAEELEKQTRPARDVVGGHINTGLGVAGKVVNRVAQQPAVQFVGRQTMKAATAVMDAQEKLDKRSQEIEERLYDSRLGKQVRHALGEDPRGKGPVEGVPIDKETTGIAIREETSWERRVRKLRESAMLGPIMQGTQAVRQAASTISSRVGDRVFGETETSLCMGEIKRDDPNFDLERFLKKIQKEMIPFVLDNFLNNRLEPLEPICTERSIAVLGALIKDRLTKGVSVDPYILELDDVELREARLVDSEPILIITFQTQQVNCTRNQKGEVVDGSPDQIVEIYYVWAMARHFSEDIAEPPTWKLHEMAIQHQRPLLA